mgnify:CR=1 FL=1
MKTQTWSVTALDLLDESAGASLLRVRKKNWRFSRRISRWMREKKNWFFIMIPSAIIGLVANGISVELLIQSGHDGGFNTEFVAVLLSIVAGIVSVFAYDLVKKPRGFLGLIGISLLLSFISMEVLVGMWSLAVPVFSASYSLLLGTYLWCREKADDHPNGGKGMVRNYAIATISPFLALAQLTQDWAEQRWSGFSSFIHQLILHLAV